VQPLWIDEELVRLARHFQAEVVANALAQSQARGTTQRGGQVDARLRRVVRFALRLPARGGTISLTSTSRGSEGCIRSAF